MSDKPKILPMVRQNQSAELEEALSKHEFPAEQLGGLLLLAASQGFKESCDVLLNHGTDINFADINFGTTALMKCCCLHSDLLEHLLAKPGCKVNATDSNGQTALHHAIIQDKEDCVAELLEAGVDINIRDKGNNSAPWLCVQKCRHAILIQLLQHGFDYEYVCPVREKTILEFAVRKGDLKSAAVLVAAGANTQNYFRQWLDLKMEYADRIPEDQENLFQAFYTYTHQIKPLKLQACVRVRHLLGQHIQQKVATLNLPEELEIMVSLQNIGACIGLEVEGDDDDSALEDSDVDSEEGNISAASEGSEGE